MPPFDEHRLISLVADLQLKRHSGELDPSFSRALRGVEGGLVENLRYLLKFNLADFTKEGDAEESRELLERVKAFDELLVEAMLSRSDSDATAAEEVLAVLPSEDPEGRLRDERRLTAPREFHEPTWAAFYRALDVREESDDEQFDRSEARKLFEFVRARVRDGDTALLPLLTLLAGRVRGERRKPLIDTLTRVAGRRPSYYQQLTDRGFLERLHAAGGAAAVADRLAAALALCRTCDLEVAEKIDEHVRRLLGEVTKQDQMLLLIGRVARDVGLSKPLQQLLLKVESEEDLTRTLFHFAAPDWRPVTLTAQRLGCQLLLKFGAGNFKPLAKFVRRIGAAQLDPAILEKLEALLTRDKQLAAQMISGKLDASALAASGRARGDAVAQFLPLVVASLANYDGQVLASVSRGLSLLMRMRMARKLDDPHYDLILASVAADPPASLRVLHDPPTTDDSKLRRLLTLLQVQIELYDEGAGQTIENISDSYYQLAHSDGNNP